MKIMVIGAGGREHALAWRLVRSQRVQMVYVAPGNAGTAHEPGLTNVALTKASELAQFCADHDIAYAIVGPEAPLAQGIVDYFESRGLKAFGPTRAAAQLESSKDFAKAFMKRHGIPTAGYETFTDATTAHAYVDRKDMPIVIKADGLAAGKGVVVAQDAAQAHDAIDVMLSQHKLGEAGKRIVIEDFLIGEEASFIVISDGTHFVPLASSQDHKRLRDGDQGPNTGGMGAYSPAPIVTPTVHGRVLREIIAPTLAGMSQEGTPFRGFLYAGLMIAPDGAPRVVEFNCRLGDPETQVIMPRLKTDPSVLIEHALAGKLDRIEAEWDRRIAITVVMAADGYPEQPRRGDEISGLPVAGNKGRDSQLIFHAGTRVDGDRVLTDGGRVLCVTALGDSFRMAHSAVYQTVETLKFDGMQFRRDIGHRAIRR